METIIVINTFVSLFISDMYLYKYQKLKKLYSSSDEKFLNNKKVLLIVYACSMVVFMSLALINIVKYTILPTEIRITVFANVIFFYVLTYIVGRNPKNELKDVIKLKKGGVIKLEKELIINFILLFICSLFTMLVLII